MSGGRDAAVRPRSQSARAARAAAVAGLLMLVAPAAGPAGAADNGSWSVSPATAGGGTPRALFSYDVAPGETIVDAVTIGNLTGEPLTLRLYAADGVTTADGGFSLTPPGEPANDVGQWVQLPVDEWTVPPRREITVDFRLRVPPSAEPGDHAGGIVAVEVPRGAGGRGIGVDVQRAVGARIYARVEGPVRPALRIEPVSTAYDAPLLPFVGNGSASTAFRVTNVGNVRLAPTARLEVDGWLGGGAPAQDLGPLGELLPGASVVVRAGYKGVPSGGRVTQRLVVTADDLEVARASSYWVVPWWFLVAVVVIVATCAALAVRRARHPTPVRGPRIAP